MKWAILREAEEPPKTQGNVHYGECGKSRFGTYATYRCAVLGHVPYILMGRGTRVSATYAT